MGRISALDLVLKSSSELEEEATAISLLSPPEYNLEKVPLPGSALETTIQKYGKPGKLLGGVLSKDITPVLEESPEEAAEIDALLEAVSNTDRGMICEPDQRLQVEKLIEGLEARAVDQNTLESDLLCQRSEVRN